MKQKKRALLHSLIALLLCVSMLVGTTFAWFTDAVATGLNTIAAGNLDVELYHTNAAVQNEQVDTATKMFLNLQGQPMLWEPGAVSYENLKVTNAGDLALAYQLSINTANENYVLDNGAQYGLSQILKVGVVEGGVTASDRQGVINSVGEGNWITLSDFLRNGKLLPEGSGESEKTWGVVIYWAPGENDNFWNLNNGKTLSTGEVLTIDLGVRLIATQEGHEADVFGTDYDAAAKGEVFPAFVGGSASATVTPDATNKTTAEVTMNSGKVSAVVPANVQVAAGVTELTMSVTALNASDANIVLGENEAVRSLDVHIEGVDPANTTPITVTLSEVAPKGLNMGNYKLYHVENDAPVEMTLVDATADFTAHNQFKYDPATGDITLYMATFSEVALVADTENAWKGDVQEFSGGTGTETDPYLIVNADQLAYMGDRVSNDNANYGSKHYKLISDINIGGIENYNTNGRKVLWYPIGYNKVGGTTTDKGNWYTYGGEFKGTFDGTGHTISGIYQNTWAMVGDYSGTYYNDAMGLFGYVNGGTIKNLTIDNFYSEGEFAPTGCVTAYAAGEATFENIAITYSHPQTYNTGVAGIVGWDEGDASNYTFRNITVDSTNTISALWGSWDVAAAGLLGYLGPNSKANLENCHVSATIDVFNDVCGNYQYYWYRYCGMLIGTVDKRLDNGKGALDLSNITAKNCTVDFGERHEYYYCEFEKNTQASYTEDYQFSRVEHSELNMDANPVTCKHTHTANEDKQAVYIPFRQIFGGYGWGVKGTELGENLADNIKDITKKDEPNANDRVKFDIVFENTDKYLYRVGNMNTVSAGTLFKELTPDLAIDSGVHVSVTSMYNPDVVMGSFEPDEKDWTKGQITFKKTGPVTVTIQDYNYCTPTTLNLEVVNAMNATSAMSATYYNVVLLNNVSGSFSVSSGHTLYGNGFKVTLPETVQSNYSAGYVGYVTMNEGNLDNVTIKGPVYPEMNIYREQAKDSSDDTKANYFYNSVYINGGNCTISNSYISGSRSAICIRGGNSVTIDNSTISGGAVANIEIAGASNVTLRDVTTAQPNTNQVMGMGIYVTSGVCKIYIEGELTQRNWINKTQWDNLVGDYSKFFPDFFGDTQYAQYQKEIDGVIYVNLAMIFACNWDEGYLNTSNQSNAASYAITGGIALQGYTGGVYSVTVSPTAGDLEEPDYEAGGFSPVIPTFSFDNTANNDADDETDAADTYCVYDQSSGTLKIGVSGDSKTIDLSGVSVTKDGKTLAHTAYLNGTQISGNSVTIKSADGTKQTLTFKAISDSGYDENGGIISGEVEYNWTVTVEIAVLAYPAPVWNMSGTYKFDTSNCYYAYYQTSQGYGEAVPIYEGIKVNYYDKSGKLVNLDLSGTTTLPTGSNNSNANAFTYTLPDGSTLTMKYGSGWKSGATTHQFTVYNEKTYIYPQSLDNDNYVRAKTTNQNFDVKITYTFTDPNGQSTETVTMNWYNAAASNDSVSTAQWKTFDGTNGKESGPCVTPDTLITLADGTQKRVDGLTGKEELLVWNMETGKLDSAPILFVDNDPQAAYRIVHLYFSDGTDVKVIYEHGFWDYDLNRYVYLDENAAQYIGHTFAKQNGSALEKVKLTDVVLETEVTTAWSPVTEGHLCYFVNGMLSMPGGVGGLFNIFEVDPATMTYDLEAMENDIAKYGLFTYEELNAIAPLSEEMFYAAGGAYLKVSIGKGNLTVEELTAMISRYSKFFD